MKNSLLKKDVIYIEIDRRFTMPDITLFRVASEETERIDITYGLDYITFSQFIKAAYMPLNVSNYSMTTFTVMYNKEELVEFDENGMYESNNLVIFKLDDTYNIKKGLKKLYNKGFTKSIEDEKEYRYVCNMIKKAIEKYGSTNGQ